MNKTVELSASLTRPANIIAYGAGDVVSDGANAHYTFTGQDIMPLRGTINFARMLVLANQVALPALELWLFSQDIPARADNEPFIPTNQNLQGLIGVIDFPDTGWHVANAGPGNAGNIAQVVSNQGIIIPSSNGEIYGQLVCRNAYTPVDSEEFIAYLTVTLD